MRPSSISSASAPNASLKLHSFREGSSEGISSEFVRGGARARRAFWVLALPLCGLFCLATGCGGVEYLENNSSGSAMTTTTAPNPSPTGSCMANPPPEIRSAIIRACSGAGCHDAVSRQGNLSLVEADIPAALAAKSLVTKMPNWVPGNLNGSYFALKMMAPSLPPGTKIIGREMPPGKPAKFQGDVDAIMKWMATVPPECSAK